VKHASREKRRRVGGIGAVAEESLSNAMLVQAYGQEAREVERVHREFQADFDGIRKEVREELDRRLPEPSPTP
jgi:hypothetical protein